MTGMSNNAHPFPRPRPGPRGSITRPAIRGRKQFQTTVVHQIFKMYDQAVREEIRLCGASETCCDECLEARQRAEELKRRLLAATRDLNSM